MIARQRHNLALTFSASEQTEVPPATHKRLFTNERELLDATQELADGMAARGAAIPALDDACGAMGQAEKQLRATDYGTAVQSEQQALAGLIRARKNIRQNLSPPSSSSAVACRTFDHQQRQKLRTPDELKKQRQQKLAESRQQMNDLAQRQRKWSDEVKSGSSSTDRDQERPQQPPPSSESPPSQSQSSSQLAQAQQQMINQLRQLEEKLKQLDSGSDQAPQQAEEVAQVMQSSLESLQKEQADKAAEQSQQSAEQLEQLADHLAAMNSSDFGERLGHAQRTAQHLAHEQTDLEQKLPGRKTDSGRIQPQAGQSQAGQSQAGQSNGDKPGVSGLSPATAGELAQQQRALASQGEMLAELMSRLRADAFEQVQATQQSLQTLHTANPPAEIVQQMHEAASEIAAGKPDQAARAAGDAARRLDELAKGLRQLRGEFGQPKLEELVALEEQIAKLIEQLDRAQSSGAPTAADSTFAGLEPKLDALAGRDARLAEALQQLRSGESAEKPGQGQDKPGQSTDSRKSQSSAAASANKKLASGGNTEYDPGSSQPVAPGFYTRSRWADRTGLRQVNKALQLKIQEAILAGALLDADDAVPPEYKDLVEKYYRELSDDLQ